MSIYRVKKDKDNPYVQINKTPLNDKRLSWKAKGLMCYMLSMSDDWKFYECELINHSKDGKDAFRSAIKELINAGYVVRGDRVRDEKGLLREYEYFIYENPIHSGKSYVGKSASNNNDYNNKFYDNDPLTKFLNEYCKQRFNNVLAEYYKEYQTTNIYNMMLDKGTLKQFHDDNVTFNEPCNFD